MRPNSTLGQMLQDSAKTDMTAAALYGTVESIGADTANCNGTQSGDPAHRVLIGGIAAGGGGIQGMDIADVRRAAIYNTPLTTAQRDQIITQVAVLP